MLLPRRGKRLMLRGQAHSLSPPEEAGYNATQPSRWFVNKNNSIIKDPDMPSTFKNTNVHTIYNLDIGTRLSLGEESPHWRESHP